MADEGYYTVVLKRHQNQTKEEFQRHRMMVLEKFPRFNRHRFKTEKAAKLFMGKVQKAFPTLSFDIDGPLDDKLLLDFFSIPAKSIRYKLKVYLLSDPEMPELYETEEDARREADHLQFLYPDEVVVKIVKCDQNGIEIKD